MNLNRTMNEGIRRILKTALRFSLRDRDGWAFLTRILPEMRKSARLREQNEAVGTHVPPFLIASIASQCNLHCAGCYARAGGCCAGERAGTDLSAQDWARILKEASALGVSFVLLAGGEPFTRRDVIREAAGFSNMIFPIFTNGTLLGPEDLRLLEEHRNLIPIFSIEGERADTDRRRGAGISQKMDETMTWCAEKHLLYGVSITVSKENLDTVLAPTFLPGLREKGCGVAFLVEYVPVELGTEHLALGEEDLHKLEVCVKKQKAALKDMILLSFPGDEAAMGGCLASGRGFFHINPQGGAEPCPFSPYAAYSLQQTEIGEVLRSHHFEKLRAIAASAGDSAGGCALFARREQVQKLLLK